MADACCCAITIIVRQRYWVRNRAHGVRLDGEKGSPLKQNVMLQVILSQKWNAILNEKWISCQWISREDFMLYFRLHSQMNTDSKQISIKQKIDFIHPENWCLLHSKMFHSFWYAKCQCKRKSHIRSKFCIRIYI